jgi:hypothetical protein
MLSNPIGGDEKAEATSTIPFSPGNAVVSVALCRNATKSLRNRYIAFTRGRLQKTTMPPTSKRLRFDPDADAPPLRYLPSSLWLIGLGHLGQAAMGVSTGRSGPRVALGDIRTESATAPKLTLREFER